MSKPNLTVGLIGYAFMGRAHSNAYRQVGRFFDLPLNVRMKTICGRPEGKVREAADHLGWEGYATDWRAVIDDPEIDVIDVSTAGDSHAEIAIAAAEAGKMVWCEKPIGNTLAEAEAMRDAVARSGKMSVVFHNYRRAPAVALAKQLIEEGKLGRIFHYRAVYLQDWIVDPNFPRVWRLNKAETGSGALGDIGSHIIDLGRHLIGEFQAVNAEMRTFIDQRPAPDGSGEMWPVDVDDAVTMLARFENGTMGTLEASRFAPGRRNFNRFEINGSEGSLVFNLENMNLLEYYDANNDGNVQGFRTISVTEDVHPYTSAYWPSGHIIGYEHTFINTVRDAILAVDKGERFRADMEDGYRNQRVMDAAERSAESGTWADC